MNTDRSYGPGDIPALLERISDLERLLEVQEKVVEQQSDKRKVLIARLQQSERNFKALVEHLPDAVLVQRADGYVLEYVNRATCRLLGYRADELVGRDGIELFIHEDDRAKLRAYRTDFESGTVLAPVEVRWVCRDGKVVQIEGSRTAITYDGEPAVLVISRDVTEATEREQARARAVTSLQQSEARYRDLFQNSPLAKTLFDPDSLRILAVNDAAVSLYGYTEEEFLELKVTDLKPGEDLELLEGMVQVRKEASGGRRHKPWRGTKKHKRKGGQLIDVDITSHPVVMEGKTAMLATGADVTERLRLEEQLRQTQKMEAIGQLAGGVAHDFNNLLSVILSYTSLIIDELKSDDPLAADLRQVRLAGERAAGLTRQLLAFSRKQILEPKTVNLNAIVEGLDKMLSRLVGEEIQLSTNLHRTIGRVFVDPGQVEQVLMNLVLNARDAMPNGGRISVESANVDLDGLYAAAHPGVKPGRHVMLAVTDTGHGMGKETQARIFEPFFTTKEKGKGTGLGLSTVLGIVQQSAGHISVYSEVGKGTTVKVYFPRTDAASDETRTTVPPLARGTETILLIEDEELVRRSVRAILSRQGYRILEAQNGGEAFMLSERHAGQIDLLLTDVVMPVMGGREVAERLLADRPQMKVLYMSGYTEHSIVHHGVLEPGIAFLPKPITPATLAGKVREVLAGE